MLFMKVVYAHEPQSKTVSQNRGLYLNKNNILSFRGRALPMTTLIWRRPDLYNQSDFTSNHMEIYKQQFHRFCVPKNDKMTFSVI